MKRTHAIAVLALGGVLSLVNLASPSIPADGPEEVVAPSANLSPEDVIRFQISALSAAGDVNARVKRCYQFASPDNRAYTGPLKRFTDMVQSPTYNALLRARHFLVGRATIQGKEAHLLLTVVDSNGELRVFRCFLSKQTNPQYRDCWMTDGVFPVGLGKPANKSTPLPTI